MPPTILPIPGEAASGTVDSLDLSAVGQCLNGDLRVITGLELQGFPADRVCIRHNTFLQDGEATPRCIIAPFGFRLSASEGTNRESVVHALALLSFHWSQGMDAISKMGQCLYAWEQVYLQFSKKPARDLGFTVDANGACVKQTTVESAEALNFEAWRRGFMVVHMIVDHSIRMPYPNP